MLYLTKIERIEIVFFDKKIYSLVIFATDTGFLIGIYAQ